MEAEAWADLRAVMPLAVQRSLLPWEWNRERLWALELPVSSVTLDSLVHVLDVPLWRGEDGIPFTTRPNDVLARPAEHPSQLRRVMSADLGFPVHLTRLSGRRVVLDGVHRVAKAALLGWREVAAHEVPPTAYPLFAVRNSGRRTYEPL